MRADRPPKHLHDKDKEKLATFRKKAAQLAKKYGLIENSSGGCCMGECSVTFEGDELLLQVGCDRFYGREDVDIGTKIPRRPRVAPGWFNLGRIRGYVDGLKEFYDFESLDEQIEWLTTHADTVMNTAFLNSEDLHSWNKEVLRKVWKRKR